MYLGFLIHVFLHFVIMQTRIGGASGFHANDEMTEPLLPSNEIPAPSGLSEEIRCINAYTQAGDT